MVSVKSCCNVRTMCTRRTSEYEEELCKEKKDHNGQRQLLDAIRRMQPRIVLHRLDISKDVCPERLDAESSHIKEEEEKKEISHLKEEVEQQTQYIKEQELQHRCTKVEVDEPPDIKEEEDEEVICKVPFTGVLQKSTNEADREAPSTSSCQHMTTKGVGNNQEESKVNGILAPRSKSDNMSLNADEDEEDEDDSEGVNLTSPTNSSQTTRILCWIMTGPKNMASRTEHIKETWAKRCHVVLYMSSVQTDFPTVKLNVSEGREHLYWKTIRAFEYISKEHLDNADWFLKADDDTYVIVENLLSMLSNLDPEKPLYLGRRFQPFVRQGYMSGGAGYVLSKEALRRFMKGLATGACTHFSSIEDMALGKCMETMKVEM